MTDPQPGSSPAFRRFERFISLAGMTCLNFFILFAVLNLVVGQVVKHWDLSQKAAVRQASPYTPHRLTHLRFPQVLLYLDEDAYEDVQTSDVEGMLDEMSQGLPTHYVYESWVGFRPEPYQGKYVNNRYLVDPEFTYRASVPPDSAPTNEDVYLFGGSTTYGYNATDAWTLGSCLWPALDHKAPAGVHVNLVNFGRPVYYSTQEAQLFRRLLQAGHVPRVAVFMDGLNDVITMATRTDKTTFDPLIAKAVYDAQYGKAHELQDWQWVPIVKLAYMIRARWQAPAATANPLAIDTEPAAQFVLQRYRDNRTMILDLARHYGVKCYFFWQPVPYYHYDKTLSLRYPDNAPMYQALYERCYELERKDPDTIFFGDTLQEYGHRKVFVDPVHYNLPFTRFLAGKMADRIELPAAGTAPPTGNRPRFDASIQ